jgi:hypothetical protein
VVVVHWYTTSRQSAAVITANSRVAAVRDTTATTDTAATAEASDSTARDTTVRYTTDTSETTAATAGAGHPSTAHLNMTRFCH